MDRRVLSADLDEICAEQNRVLRRCAIHRLLPAILHGRRCACRGAAEFELSAQSRFGLPRARYLPVPLRRTPGVAAEARAHCQARRAEATARREAAARHWASAAPRVRAGARVQAGRPLRRPREECRVPPAEVRRRQQGSVATAVRVVRGKATSEESAVVPQAEAGETRAVAPAERIKTAVAAPREAAVEAEAPEEHRAEVRELRAAAQARAAARAHRAAARRSVRRQMGLSSVRTCGVV